MALKDKIIDRAQKYIQKGNLDKAIAEYKAAIDLDPKDIAIRLRLGELYVKINRTADAIKEYSEAAKANTQRGFYLKAIAVYKQLLKLDDNLDVHYRLADLYAKQRLIADAISEYSHIVASFEKKNKHNDVLELLKKMIEIDPENIGVRIKLAELYQALVFEKDAMVEYEGIFKMLLEQGKVEKAEKVYLGVYKTNPGEPVILKGLCQLYAKKDDSAKFLKFAVTLFHIYAEADETDAAAEICGEILKHRPDDAECLEFLQRSGQKDQPFSAMRDGSETEQSAPDETTAPVPESWTEETKAEVKQEEQEPVAQLEDKTAEPEEQEPEIEISLEGFDETPEKPSESASEPTAEEVLKTAEDEPGAAEAHEEDTEVEIEIGDIEADGLKAEVPGEEVSVEAAAEAEEEVAAEAPLEIEEVHVQAEEPEVEVSVEAVAEAEEEVAAEAPLEIEEVHVQAEEPEVEVSVEAEAEEEVAAEVEAEATVETPVEAQDTTTLAAAGPSDELDHDLEKESEPLAFLDEGLDEAIEEVNQKISEAEERQQVPESKDGFGRGAVEISTADLEHRIDALLDDEDHGRGAIDIFEGIERETAGQQVAASHDETPSESAETLVEASEAVAELIENVGPDDMLVEPERPGAEKVPGGAPGEDYVDLSAELGMEETVQDMAGSWGEAGSTEAYDEFKNGISQQLSKEDTETHYNLGIAYMEMELFSEAAKEFKIALKDPHLEFDCFTRLGLCLKAEGSPEEAVAYYQKGLKVEGRTESEKRGMMYELALAYEAAGDTENASQIFNAIYDADPDYREVSQKVSLAVPRPAKKRAIPLDDDIIDVEFL